MQLSVLCLLQRAKIICVRRDVYKRQLVNLPIVVKDFETGIKTEQGEDRCIAVSYTHLETDMLNMPMDDITNLPQFRFRFTEYQSVIAIAIVITNPVLILQIVV